MYTRILTNPYLAVGLFVLGIATWYCAMPLWMNYVVSADPYFLMLAFMVALAAVSVAAGFGIPWLDSRFGPSAGRVRLSEPVFQGLVWGSFLIFAAVVVATAQSIPLVSSLMGASEIELSVERGAFLKTRTGWQAALPYMSTAYIGALLPYTTARLFVQQHPMRFAALGVFLLYTLLALEKAAFIFALGPLFWLFLKHARYRAAIATTAAALALLYVNTVLARGGFTAERAALVSHSAPESTKEKLPTHGSYFSAKYQPKNAVDHILFRAFVVPVVTASDALRVFHERFDGQHFLGATSSFVAKITGQTRVNYDAEVFAHQYGRSEIGRSNSVYLTEAYVNFGWFGVIAFSLFVGQALRWLQNTPDEALHVMWPLFCWQVFNAGLIGTLLSNGYAAIFALALFGCIGLQTRLER